MRKKIKCYLVFTPLLYRVILFAVVPIVLLVQQVYMAQMWEEHVLMSLNILTMFLLLVAEVIFDYWAFGGIAVKESVQLTYLKTSARGMGLLSTALVVNLVRQLLTGLLPMLLGLVCRWQTGDGPTMDYAISSLAFILLGYVFLVTASTIARFFDGWLIHVAVANIAGAIMIWMGLLVWAAPVGALAVLLLLSVVVSIVSVWLVVNRVKEGYHDRAV